MQSKSLLALLAVGAASFGFGWYAREATYDPPVERDVRKTRPPTQLEDTAARERAVEAALERAKAKRAAERVEKGRGPGAGPSMGTAAEPPPADEEAAPTSDPGARAAIDKMVESLAPQWKTMARMQVKPKIAALLAALGFDEETSKRIEEAMLADVDLAMDRVIGMMTGAEEMDPDLFMYFMGIPPDLSQTLERDLSVFLNDHDMARVRSEVKRAYDQSLTDLADSQIELMRLGNLTTDQKTRLRDVFRGKNYMQEQFQGFAEMTSKPDILAKVAGGEIDMGAEIRKSLEPQKRAVAEILTPEQMAGWERYEQSMVAQAEWGVKMMSAVFKQQPQPKAATGDGEDGG